MTAPDTEARHPSATGLHTRAGVDALGLMLEAQVAALQAVRPALAAIERASSAAAGSLAQGGKLGYAGAGSSGLMALADCLEMAGTFGVAPDRTPMMFAGGARALLHMQGRVEDDVAQAAHDLADAGLAQGDTLLCLSASGRTPYAVAIARQARAQGVSVVAFANVAGTPLLELADIPVLIATGPEMVAGSTRLGAATAQKVALNMLSSLVGVKLDHVHDGYMVNLVADNAKLIDRAARIVMAVAQVDRMVAEAALQATAGAVKPAIVVARGRSPDQARADLAEHGGVLADLI